MLIFRFGTHFGVPIARFNIVDGCQQWYIELQEENRTVSGKYETIYKSIGIHKFIMWWLILIDIDFHQWLTWSVSLSNCALRSACEPPINAITRSRSNIEQAAVASINNYQANGVRKYHLSSEHRSGRHHPSNRLDIRLHRRLLSDWATRRCTV